MRGPSIVCHREFSLRARSPGRHGSAGRPRQAPTSQHVHVGVKHLLLRRGTGVEDAAIAGHEPLQAGHLADHIKTERYGG